MLNKTMNNRKGFVCQRIIGLDILRISLAILIYMFHSWMHFGCSYSYLNDFVSVGAIAMTGFFLLSGYSLRMVYGDKNLIDKHDLGIFYLKRVLGILPLYYFFAILYVLFLGKESLLENILLFPIEAFGLQSTFTSLFGVTHNGGTWFISCIILAYLLYPFLQTICKYLNTRYKVVMLLLLVFLDVWGGVISHKFNTAHIYDNPFYRILEFSCGLLVADINMKSNSKLLHIIRTKWTLVSAILLLIFGVSLMRHYFQFGDYMLYNVIVLPCFAIMLFSFGTIRMPILERSNVIGYLGKISYAFFLTQFFAWKVGRIFIGLIGYDHNWVRILVTFVYCVLASIFVYECVQKPIVKLVRRSTLIKVKQ